MNNHLLFSFLVNKDTRTVEVQREFAADLDLVWEAWTNPEILDQWWAPKPYRNITKSMDFREGGMWLYSMVSPQDEVHWCKNEYQKIEHQKNFSGLDTFCDEDGKTNEDFPRTLWTNTFTQNVGTTTVTVVAQYDNLADLEQVIAMGFEEGFTMGLNQLDELLRTLKK